MSPLPMSTGRKRGQSYADFSSSSSESTHTQSVFPELSSPVRDVSDNNLEWYCCLLPPGLFSSELTEGFVLVLAEGPAGVKISMGSVLNFMTESPTLDHCGRNTKVRKEAQPKQMTSVVPLPPEGWVESRGCSSCRGSPYRRSL